MKIKAKLIPGSSESSVGVVVSEMVARQEKRRKQMAGMGGMFARASIFLDRWAQTNIRTEGKNVGGWAPFKYGGRVTPDGIDTSAKLLQDTGRLRASILPFASNVNAGIMTDLPYAAEQNKTRRIMPVPEEVLNDVRKIVKGHVAASINLDKGVTR